MGDYRYINFTVRCPRDNYKERPMQIRLIKKEDGTWFPLPCNGCDELNGSKICEECMASVTILFFNNPEADTTAPLSLALPKS